jgi:hypothetical protein
MLIGYIEVTGGPRMNALEIALEWYKDSKGYRLNGEGKSRTVVGRGGRLVPTQPLRNDMVFLAFAGVESDRELMKFVHHYGLLEEPSYDESFGMTSFDAETLALIPSRPILYGEYVEDHLATARMFRELLALTVQKGWASRALSDWITDRMLGDKLGNVSLGLVSGRGFQIRLRADSLFTGMLMQLARKISGQSQFRACDLCNKLFEVGPNAGRRADATFCSPEHKIQFHSRKRSIRS